MPIDREERLKQHEERLRQLGEERTGLLNQVGRLDVQLNKALVKAHKAKCRVTDMALWSGLSRPSVYERLFPRVASERRNRQMEQRQRTRKGGKK